jgi:hypothetical protein
MNVSIAIILLNKSLLLPILHWLLEIQKTIIIPFVRIVSILNLWILHHKR